MANDHIADDRKKVRLIDANALIHRVCAERDSMEINHACDIGYHNGLNMAVSMAINAPTVDAAPVVHGEWIEGYDWNIAREKIERYTILCSECDNTFETKTEEEREYWKKRFKVCPFCGAIMDGERRNEDGKID